MSSGNDEGRQTAVSAGTACSTDLTFEDVKAAVDTCRRELMATDTPDVYVMTTAAFQTLRREVEASAPAVLPGSLLGIPVEHYPTLREVHERCLELRGEGKSVALVCQ